MDNREKGQQMKWTTEKRENREKGQQMKVTTEKRNKRGKDNERTGQEGVREMK